MFLGKDSKIHDIDQGGISSYQPPDAEQEIQTEESLGLVSIEDLKDSDIVIAVMGPTGSGKSTLVCSASGRTTGGVGSGLKSFTSDVRAIRFRDQKSGQIVVLVDTPGFGDTYESDLDILNMISDWLSSSYKKDKLLSAILYLHRITDNRAAGISLKNLRVFRKLCGDDALEKIYFTTTMWDEVEEEVGNRRLEELKSEYWNVMIAHGAHVFRFKNDDSKDLIGEILKDESTRRVLFQEQMVEMLEEIKKTAAGRELYSKLEVLFEKHIKVKRRLKEAREAAEDPQLVLDLEREYAELREKMDERIRELESSWMCFLLKMGRSKTILSVTSVALLAFMTFLLL